MKFYGTVGFWEDDIEVTPGVFKSGIIERNYTGDVLQDYQRWSQSDTQNGNFTVSNRISILGDLYAQENWPSIKYVIWSGKKWTVTRVTKEYPRLTLEIGEVYNGTNPT